MALRKFGHFKLVGKISQKVFELEAKNKNHLIFLELWPFENLGILDLGILIMSLRYLENYLS